ncbi:MAG TPA: IPT/TIG domain-containing protein, partial [Chthonomonadaceae bacterium]|nr:IPT/TIG domain-containing protein [Chthonomonadaceae bacterium]
MLDFRKLFPALILLACLFMAAPGRAQSWSALTNQPSFYGSSLFLLTDGTVLCQDYDANDWWKLTPDINGSYKNGTWSQIASPSGGYSPLYYASAVLPDGRLLVDGGEYNGGNSEVWTTLGAIYDPVANTWTSVSPPSGWSYIGDAQSCVLPNGTILLAYILNGQMASFNASNLTWTNMSTSGKADRFDEENWTLLPNGKMLTVDVTDIPNSELFNSSTNAWSSAGNTPYSIVDATDQEIGPAVLRPDGTVICFGGNGSNAVYNSSTGAWSSAPSFPVIGGSQYDVADGPACLLPSGNVLVMASPGYGNSPSHFFEFNGSTLTQVADSAEAANVSSFYGRMLMLPTGQVLFTDYYNYVEIYTPSGTYNSAWQPTISSCTTTPYYGATYSISGTQFNGLSQAVSYGDDYQGATNYPLVRIVNNATGHVFYCRTHGHSTMAVATGSTTVSTNFDVPSNIESGPSKLYVVANGIPSAGYAVTVGVSISSLSPSSTPADGSSFTLTVNGANFQNGAVVKWNGTALSTTFVSSSQVTATVPSTDITTPGTASVTVANSDGHASSAATFTITNPVPVLGSISPTSATAGGSSFTLTASGADFINGSTIDWNGTALTTTFVNSTTLTATVPAGDIATAGTASVTVVTPSPGGGTSSPQTFTINGSTQVPTLSKISPSSVLAGGPSFTLTATGTNFVASSVVEWNGTALTTTYVSATSL